MAAPLGRRWGFIYLLLLLLASGGLAAAGLLHRSAVAPSSGVLRVSPQELVVKAENSSGPGKQTVEIQLSNAGDGPLRVGEIQASCGCTIPQALPSTLLGPGEQTALKVQATPPAYGERLSRLLIHTDSQRTPRVPVALRLRGEELRVPFTTLWPDVVRLEGKGRGEIREHELIVRTMEAKGSQPWLLNLRPDHPAATAERLQMVDEKGLSDQSIARMYRFRLSVPIPSSDDAPVVTQLVPELSQPGQKGVPPIRVSASWLPPVRAIPRELFVSLAGRKDLPVERTVVLLSSEETPLSVAAAPVAETWLEVGAPEPLGPGESVSTGAKAARIAVRITSMPIFGDTNGLVRTTIRLRTSHSEREWIEIPVAVYSGRAVAD